MATRRQVLIIGAGVTGWLAAFQVGPGLLSRLSGFDFAPFERVSGFRTISAGRSSATGGVDVMAGLDRRTLGGDPTEVARNPARALFFAGDGAERTVPLAYFFDYYCPYCRVLSGHIGNLVAGSAVALSRHHWPLLGKSSVLAARAALGAGQLGAGEAMHARLTTASVRVTSAYLRQVANGLGLSWARLEDAMYGAETNAALERSAALARLFAFIGTPSLVVGRTVVEGEIPEARLRDLVTYEREDGGAPVSG